jgi:hypothetical protein
VICGVAAADARSVSWAYRSLSLTSTLIRSSCTASEENGGAACTEGGVGRETQRRQAACRVKKYAAMHQSKAAQKTPYARGMAVTERTPAEAGP